MRNMKSLHIFRIIVIKREEKFQGSLWEYEKPKDTLGMWKAKGHCNPKVTLELYICNFLIWERVQNFSFHTFCWLVNKSILFSSFSLVLWVVSCEVFFWFDFMLFIAICGLFSYSMGGMDHFGCTHVPWTTSFCMLSLE